MSMRTLLGLGVFIYSSATTTHVLRVHSEFTAFYPAKGETAAPICGPDPPLENSLSLDEHPSSNQQGPSNVRMLY